MSRRFGTVPFISGMFSSLALGGKMRDPGNEVGSNKLGSAHEWSGVWNGPKLV